MPACSSSAEASFAKILDVRGHKHANAAAAAGERFSSSSSFTDTWATDARIRGHELFREFDVLFIEIRIVLEDLLRRGAAEHHLSDMANRETALRKHWLTAEDVVARDETNPAGL
jgi:hypothetical protein